MRTQRHCEMLGPEILVFAPAALCERLAQGVPRKSRHLRWTTNPRTGGPRDGRLGQVPPWYFLTRVVPPNRSHRSSTWCRRIWHYPGVACLRLCSVRGRCYFRLLFFYSLSFSSLLAFRSSAPSMSRLASGVSFTSAHLGRLFVGTYMGRFSTSTTWTMARRVDARRR